jgi:hypothetical protein
VEKNREIHIKKRKKKQKNAPGAFRVLRMQSPRMQLAKTGYFQPFSAIFHMKNNAKSHEKQFYTR